MILRRAVCAAREGRWRPGASSNDKNPERSGIQRAPERSAGHCTTADGSAKADGKTGASSRPPSARAPPVGGKLDTDDGDDDEVDPTPARLDRQGGKTVTPTPRSSSCVDSPAVASRQSAVYSQMAGTWRRPICVGPAVRIFFFLFRGWCARRVGAPACAQAPVDAACPRRRAGDRVAPEHMRPGADCDA